MKSVLQVDAYIDLCMWTSMWHLVTRCEKPFECIGTMPVQTQVLLFWLKYSKVSWKVAEINELYLAQRYVSLLPNRDLSK